MGWGAASLKGLPRSPREQQPRDAGGRVPVASSSPRSQESSGPKTLSLRLLLFRGKSGEESE